MGRFTQPDTIVLGDHNPQNLNRYAYVNGNPMKYSDQYRENLMRIIKGKVKGKDVTLERPSEPRQGEVVDLMERLRKSLAASEGRKARKQASRSEPRSAAAHRRRHKAS